MSKPACLRLGLRGRFLTPEWREIGESVHFVGNHIAFAREELRDRTAEGWIGNPMGTVRRRRQIAALDFVRPLRARLDALRPAA